MGKVNFFIDGVPLSGDENEPILNAARAEGIFIPAICYLNRCSASLACRLCLVEADGKQVFSCNAKPKEGMQVVTNSDGIKAERRAIMEVYDINHPLECGVCDKSGNCELQNYTMEMGVDSQNQKIADCHRPIKNWGLVKYDASLCIVCERCVTVCKDMVGDNALTTVPRGGSEIDKEFKESMPKNAYTIWNKMNKSIIGAKAGDSLDCTMCGECIAVCPVGALTSPDFTYKSNSWELEKIPSSCAHCSSACHLTYEVKHTAIENSDPKIYRVTNEWNFQSLCGAGRFGFDYQNSSKKDEKAFDCAVEAFKKAKSIRFNSFITNEEAMMLQTIKEKFGVRLVNDDANSYFKFLKTYSAITGKSLYSADTASVHNANFVVSLGSDLKNDAPMVRFAMNNAITMNKGAGLYFHPVFDTVVGSMNKNLLAIVHKAGSEEGLMWLLLDLFADRSKLPHEHITYLESMEHKYTKTITEKIKKKVEDIINEKVPDENGSLQDVQKTVIREVEESITKEVEVKSTHLLEKIGLEIDAIEKIEALYAKKDMPVLVLGSDLYLHPRASQIAALTGLLQISSGFEILIVPPSTNTLGVSLICDIDNHCEGFTVGYNEEGDFTLSSLSGESNENSLAMPALNQQEGTFTSIDKRVVPINAALAFDGYELNDIMNALDCGEKLTVDWTKKLPQIKGFINKSFDDLPNEFGNSGARNIGYLLETKTNDAHLPAFDKFDESMILGGTIAYAGNPVLQFNDFTAKCSQLSSESNTLQCSQYFADGHELKSGDTVVVVIHGYHVDLIVDVNTKLIGSCVVVPVFASKSPAAMAFSGKFAFQSVNLTKG
jgi:NADH-quinone oxidoreductase subunit G